MAHRDDLDELAARLFRAARAEAPSDEARKRALRVARRAVWRSAGVYAVALAAAAAVVLLAWPRLRDGSEPRLEAEPLPLRAPPAPASAAPPIQPSPERGPEAPTAVPHVAKPSRSLADEVATLDRVREALAVGDGERALALLDANPARRLTDEATLLRIEALKRAKRDASAAELARRFVEENPASPLVDRARALVGDPAARDGGAPP